jgi:hypothetical protein
MESPSISSASLSRGRRTNPLMFLAESASPGDAEEYAAETCDGMAYSAVGSHATNVALLTSVLSRR